MVALYNRQFALNLGGTAIATSVQDPTKIHSTLRVAFKVERSLRREPNKAEVSIWNLSGETRGKLADAKDLAVTLDIGYANEAFQVYSGEAMHIASQRQGVDWVTKIELSDGGRRYQSARINESLGPGVTVAAALQKAAEAIGLPLGNLLDKAAGGNTRGAKQSFPNGLVLSGSAVGQFDKLAKMAGLEWSIQDGQIQALVAGEALPQQAVLLRADSGLVGSPEVGEKGIVKARSLVQSGLFPGRPVVIEAIGGSKPVQGSFRIDRVVYSGDTWGTEWYADLEAMPL